MKVFAVTVKSNTRARVVYVQADNFEIRDGNLRLYQGNAAKFTTVEVYAPGYWLAVKTPPTTKENE